MIFRFLITYIVFSTSFLFPQILQDYGFKFGLIQSEQEWNYLDESIEWTTIENSFKTKNGLKVGIFSEWKLISNINVLVEFNYAQKGSKQEIKTRTLTNPEGIGEKIDWLYPVDYFEIPLQLKLHMDLPKVSFFVSVGYRYDHLYYKKAFGTTLQRDVNKSNLGYTSGIGLKLGGMFATPIIFEFRYNPDRTFMYETDKLRITNSTIDILIGVIL